MAADNRISDEALVSAMAAGDQDALATLNQRYGRALSAVADRILRDKPTPKKSRRMSCGSSGARRRDSIAAAARLARGS